MSNNFSVKAFDYSNGKNGLHSNYSKQCKEMLLGLIAEAGLTDSVIIDDAYTSDGRKMPNDFGVYYAKGCNVAEVAPKLSKLFRSISLG